MVFASKPPHGSVHRFSIVTSSLSVAIIFHLCDDVLFGLIEVGLEFSNLVPEFLTRVFYDLMEGPLKLLL